MISNGRWFVFMEHDIQKAENLKMIMCAFEQVSGSRLIFTIVKSSASGEPKRSNNSIRPYLVVRPMITRLSILAY